MSIRLATPADAQQILTIYAPYVETTAITFETVIPTLKEMERRVKSSLEKHSWLVLEEGNEVLAYAYASQHRERSAYRWSVDVSVYVKEGNQRRGMGKALYVSLLPILRLEGYRNAYAGICLPNDASVGLHEYLDFQKVAHYNKVGYKLGKWHDVGWWELTLQEHDDVPSEPIPFDARKANSLL